jgi:hypothetical protein
MDALTQIVKLAPYFQSGFLVLAATAIVSFVYLVRHAVERQETITEPALKAVAAYRWLPITACVLAATGLDGEKGLSPIFSLLPFSPISFARSATRTECRFQPASRSN